jgi:hypothetical protein
LLVWRRTRCGRTCARRWRRAKSWGRSTRPRSSTASWKSSTPGTSTAVPVCSQELAPRRHPSRETDPGGLALAIVSIVAAIPITAIAAGMIGQFGVVICWAGLVAINFARTMARRG